MCKENREEGVLVAVLGNKFVRNIANKGVYVCVCVWV